MATLGERLTHRMIVPSNGMIELSGDIKAEHPGQLRIAFKDLNLDAPKYGLSWDKSEQYSYREHAYPAGSSTFRVCLNAVLSAGDSITVLFERGNATGSLEIKCDQWPVAGTVFVHGGCVSRDTFEFPGSPPLAEYRARSSMISAMSRSETGINPHDLLENKSAFQRRMVATDVERQLPDMLASVPYTVFFIDLVVERTKIGLVKKAPVTITPEFLACGLEPLVDRIFDNTSEDYYRRFKKAWQKLCGISGEHRVVVNRVFLATRYSDHTPVPGRKDIHNFNYKLARLYSIIEEVTPRVRWITYSPACFVADADHRWGPAPYHYIPELHRSQLEQLNTMLTLTDATGEMSAQPLPRNDVRNIVLKAIGSTTLKDSLRFDFSPFEGAAQVWIALNLDDRTGNKDALVSFGLTDRDGNDISPSVKIVGMHYSPIEGVGWYTYLPTEPGNMFWIRNIDMPNGVFCHSIKIQRWGDNSAAIRLEQLRIELN